MSVAHKILRPLAREGDLSPFIDYALDQQAGNEDRTEERGQNTDNQRSGETLHRTVSEDEQNDTGDDRGKVTVDDRGVCFRETVLDSQAQTLTAAKLLLDAFVNNHVGIHGHTHRQHDTRDTGQRQHGTERNQNTEQQEYVAQQGDIGQPAGCLIVEAHIEKHQHEREYKRKNTRIDRLLPQRRTYDGILNNTCRSGHLTRLEHVGEVFRLLNGEVTRDFRTSAFDLLANDRSGIDITVEHDGDAAADIVARQTRPVLNTFRVHRHRNLGFGTALGIGFTRIHDHAAVQRSLAVGRADLERIKRETPVVLRFALDTPLETNVRRQQLAHGIHTQVAGNGRRIGNGYGTHDSASAIIGIEQREERIFLAGIAGCPRSRGSLLRSRSIVLHLCDQAFGRIFGTGSSRLLLSKRFLHGRIGRPGSQFVAQKLIGLLQGTHQLGVIISRPELERSGTLQQLAYALRLLHARQLDQNTVRIGQALDVGLRNAEMVDTTAQDVERSVDRSVGFLLQDLLDLAVRAVRRDILTIRTYEKRSQRSTAGNLTISLGELADVVVGTLFKRLVGTGDGLLEHRIVCAVTCQGFQHVLHLHLEHDIHTALQVETQVDLLLLDLLVGE